MEQITKQLTDYTQFLVLESCYVRFFFILLEKKQEKIGINNWLTPWSNINKYRYRYIQFKKSLFNNHRLISVKDEELAFNLLKGFPRYRYHFFRYSTGTGKHGSF
jgi:hypothetical protein